MSIVKLPVEKVFPRVVRGKEVWAQNEPPQEMVWEVCPYTRSTAGDGRCMHCPPSEIDPDYGPMQRGCYGLAAE